MSMELTDAIINQILFLSKKRFNRTQISIVTGVTPCKVSKILNAKYVNKKSKERKDKFSWGEYKSGVL